jgi:KDO2-lipid IV(A) lauroyltransferase
MYWFLRLLGAIIGRLSTDQAQAVARALAWFLFDICRLRRTLILQNIQRAFPHLTAEERLRMGRTSVEHFCCTILEIFYSTRNDIIGQIDVVGGEYMQQALSKGQGVYVLCSHLGNWEAMGAKYTRDICPARVIVKKIGVKSVNRFVEEVRERNGFLSISRKKKGDGFRQILDTLQKNQIVGFVMDQARRGEPSLAFFGHPARTNTSFAAIWRRHPAPILPSFMVRHSFNRHTIHIWPPVEPQATSDTEADIITHSQLFNDVVERMVRFKPEQYFWMHDRWK